METSLHLFFEYAFSEQVWSLAPFLVHHDLAEANSLQEALRAVSASTCLPPTGISLNLVSWVC